MLLRLGATLSSDGPLPSAAAIAEEAAAPAAAAVPAAAAAAAAAPFGVAGGRRPTRRARRQPEGSRPGGERRGEGPLSGAAPPPLDAAGAQERLHLDAISLWLDDALEEV